MTPGQRRVALGLAVLVACAVLLVMAGVGLEFYAVSLDDSATISELMWLVWAHQPWTLFLAWTLFLFPVAFLAGHFVAQNSGTYDRIRGSH